MKASIKNLLWISLSSLFLWSCQKDEEQARLQTGPTPTLTASANNLVLQQSNGSAEAITLTWNAAEYGFKAATTYRLQMATIGSNFAAASTTEVIIGNSLQRKFTVTEINKELLKIIPATIASDVDIRVKADIGTTVPSVYSNVVTIRATPYRDIIEYPSLWVPGDYQGWNPASAPKISSKASSNQYEGYINMASGSLQFKFTSHPDWNHTTYGWASSTTTGDKVDGTMNTNGGNLFVPSAGYYLVTANTTDLKWSATKIRWGLIGDAIPVTGWSSDQDLTFNAATGLWTITLPLTSGSIKFRANDAWDIELGDNNADNVPDYKGSNIAITAAGNYTITLDLSIAGNYSYSVKRS